MVKSNKLFSAQSYLELVTGNCYIVRGHDDVDFIETILRENELEDLWNYPLEEIDHIVENDLNVVLVECCEWDDEEDAISTEYRWFEVPDIGDSRDEMPWDYGKHFDD